MKRFFCQLGTITLLAMIVLTNKAITTFNEWNCSSNDTYQSLKNNQNNENVSSNDRLAKKLLAINGSIVANVVDKSGNIFFMFI